MKIALLLTGRIYTSSLLYNNLYETLLKHHDVDIFVSCPKHTDVSLVERFTEIYKPKKLVISDEIYFDVDKYNRRGETIKHNVMCMYLNRIKVAGLLEEYVSAGMGSVEYDFVVSSRTDLMFSASIIGSPYPDLSLYRGSEKYFIENHIWIPSPEKDYWGINDQYAFGRLPSMLVYLKTYSGLYDLLEKGVVLHPETLLANYLVERGINASRFLMEYKIERNIANDLLDAGVVPVNRNVAQSGMYRKKLKMVFS